MEQNITGSKFRTLPQEELEFLCNRIKTTPWRQVIADMNLPVVRQKPDCFTNSRNAYLYRILPAPEKGFARDIGAGSGVIAESLSKEHVSGVAVRGYGKPRYI